MMFALNDPDVVKKLVDPRFEVVASTSQEFASFLQQELTRWKKVIEVGGITMD